MSKKFMEQALYDLQRKSHDEWKNKNKNLLLIYSIKKI